MKVERITIMKKLTNDQKGQIIIYPYETRGVDEYEYPHGVNATLEVLGYEDRLRFDRDKEILVWSKVNDY